MFIATSRRATALAIAALAVVPITGCGSSKSTHNATKLSSSGAAADPASIMPGSAPLYVEATVRPSATEKAAFDALSQTILKVPNPEAKIAALIDKAAAKDNITFERDIKPWLGAKLAVAITSYGTGNKPDFAAAIDTTDPKQALATIDKSHPNLVKGKTNGVSYEVEPDGSYVGTVGDILVVGTPAGFQAVAAAQNGPKLADQAAFKQARNKAPADRLGYVYVDTTALLKLAAASDPTVASQLSSFSGLIGNIKAVSASLVATPTSIEIDASTVGGTSSSTGAAGVSAFPIAKAPGDAWLAVGVRNLGPKLNTAITELGKIGAASNGQNFAQILAQLKQSTGVDIQQDLLSWMGDAGVFVKGTTSADIGAALIIKSTDPTASRAAIGKIAGLLARLGRTAHKITVPGGGTGIQIATSATGPPVQIAATGSLFVIALGKDALGDALSPATTLDSTPTFQAAAASLKGATPSVYVDLQTLIAIGESFAGSSSSLDAAKPYLSVFQSLVAGSKNGVAKLVINVK